MPRLIPKTQKEDLTGRVWRIDPRDSKTCEKLLELLHNTVQGPIAPVSFYHSIYKYRERKLYKAPYPIIKFFIDNRDTEGYDFFSFSKISENQPFQLHREGKKLHDGALQKMFRPDIII